MTTPFPFVAGTVLQASALNAITTLPINDQTASYTLVVGDVGKRVIMNVASASTVTVNNSIFSEGDTIFIANKASDASVITAGAGVTINVSGSLSLAQYGGGTLLALSASTFTFFPAGGVGTVPSTVEYLVIAGGGGGGNATGSFNGGGGGAGGYRNSTSGEDSGGGAAAETPINVTAGVTYTITVGNGGASNAPGTDSSIAGTGLTTITSVGGGRGKGTDTNANGGSGGGGHNTSAAAGTGTANQGFAGGAFISTSRGGGGGGSDAVGVDGNTSGNGGSGNASSISLTSVTRAGGGGGGNGGGAGAGGGGAGGATINTPGSAAVINTGGGGGGAGGGSVQVGGAGGKGVIIIRQTKSDSTLIASITSGTIVQDATHISYIFNDSSTIKWGA